MAEKSVITHLEARIRQVLEDHKRLSGWCAELASENDVLKKENRRLQEEKKQLETELSHMQLTAGLAGERQNRDKARARVNRLMREIDKCIALLTQAEQEKSGSEEDVENKE